MNTLLENKFSFWKRIFPESLRVRVHRMARISLKIAALSAGAAVAILLGYRLNYYLFESPSFRVTKVEVFGLNPELKSALLQCAKLDRLDKQYYNLFRLRPDCVRRQMESMPQIRQARIIKEYPNTLRIAAQPRKPVVIVSAGCLFLADSEGMIMERLRADKRAEYVFPIMTGLPDENIKVGSVIKSEVFFKALDLQSTLAKQCEPLYEQMSEMNINPRGEIVAIFKGGTEIRFGRRDVLERLPELDAFLSQYASSSKELTKFKYVDMRFQKQIVYALREEENKAFKK